MPRAEYLHGLVASERPPPPLDDGRCIEARDETAHGGRHAQPFLAFREAVLMSEPFILLNACGAGTTNSLFTLIGKKREVLKLRRRGGRNRASV